MKITIELEKDNEIRKLPEILKILKKDTKEKEDPLLAHQFRDISGDKKERLIHEYNQIDITNRSAKDKFMEKWHCKSVQLEPKSGYMASKNNFLIKEVQVGSLLLVNDHYILPSFGLSPGSTQKKALENCFEINLPEGKIQKEDSWYVIEPTIVSRDSSGKLSLKGKGKITVKKVTGEIIYKPTQSELEAGIALSGAIDNKITQGYNRVLKGEISKEKFFTYMDKQTEVKWGKRQIGKPLIPLIIFHVSAKYQLFFPDILDKKEISRQYLSNLGKYFDIEYNSKIPIIPVQNIEVERPIICFEKEGNKNIKGVIKIN